MAKWTFLRTPGFANKRQYYENEFSLRLEKLRADDWPSGSTDLFISEAEEFQEFTNAIDGLAASTDPLTEFELKLFLDSSSGERYYYLGIGDWRAYFSINEARQFGITLLLLHEKRSSRKQLLGELAQALKQFRENKD